MPTKVERSAYWVDSYRKQLGNILSWEIEDVKAKLAKLTDVQVYDLMEMFVNEGSIRFLSEASRLLDGK